MVSGVGAGRALVNPCETHRPGSKPHLLLISSKEVSSKQNVQTVSCKVGILSVSAMERDVSRLAIVLEVTEEGGRARTQECDGRDMNYQWRIPGANYRPHQKTLRLQGIVSPRARHSSPYVVTGEGR